MNAQSFLDNFHTIARAPGGISRVRDLVYFFAITGGLSRPETGDSDAKLILDDSLQAKLDYYEENSVRQGARKHSELIQVVKRVPSHWVMVSAGDLVHLINGRAFKAADWKKSGLPIIRIQNLNNPTAPFNYFQGEVAEGHRVRTGDMLLSWSGTPGTSFGAFIWNGGDAVLNQHIFKVAIYSSKISKEYLRMAINASLDALIGSARGGVGLKHVTKGQIESLQIPLPPLEEQKRIVARMDELMRLCDRLEAQQQEREKLLPLLSRANHIRFVAEPTEANLKVVFRERGSVSIEDLREAVLDLAESRRLVPVTADARTVSMEELVGAANLKNGLSLQQSSTPQRFHCLPISSLRDGRVDLGTRKPIVVTEAKAAPYLIRRNDVFIVRGSGSKHLMGQAGIVEDDPVDLLFPDLFIRVRLPLDQIEPKFFLLLWNGPSIRRDLEQLAKTTSGIWKINQGHICSIKLVLPPLSEQRQIVAMAARLQKTIDDLDQKRHRSRSILEAFAKAAVAAITSTVFTENDRMKPPKTEVVTALKVGKKLKKAESAPLATLLSEQTAEASAKTLWQLSGMEIDAFYRQLKTEMANGWIDEDKDKRAVMEVEAR